jgi:uncharacterized protein
MSRLTQHVQQSGFEYVDRVIHLFVGGSELHGAKVRDTDDLDIYGVYVEPPELVLGLRALSHYVWSTAGNDRRNGPADVDVTLYSLKKWASLSCKGNPTALHFLFAKSTVPSAVWRNVQKHRDIFLSRECSRHFVGFSQDQFARVTGKKGGGKKGRRPELEEKFGYDVKAAMHGLRLLYECQEILRTGVITLPRPERELLIAVHTGKYDLDAVLKMADEMFKECESAKDESCLPETLDRSRVSQLVTDCYLQSWAGQGSKPRRKQGKTIGS